MVSAPLFDFGGQFQKHRERARAAQMFEGQVPVGLGATRVVVIPGASAPAPQPVEKRKGMSAAGRSKIAAAQKARQAKIKAAKKA